MALILAGANLRLYAAPSPFSQAEYTTNIWDLGKRDLKNKKKMYTKDA